MVQGHGSLSLLRAGREHDLSESHETTERSFFGKETGYDYIIIGYISGYIGIMEKKTETTVLLATERSSRDNFD